MVSYKDLSDSFRTTDVKCIVAAFMAQHCMPCSMAGPLMDLSKRLAEDQVAVEKTTFARTCATYVTTHGVGDYVKVFFNK